MRAWSNNLRPAHLFLMRWSFYPLLLSSLLACGTYAARRYLTGSSTYIFLVWNLALAWIPYTLSLSAAMLHQRSPHRWWWLLAPGALWLLFLPNGPYIVTDLIHLRTFHEFVWWYEVGLIVSFAWSGCFLAVASLRVMHALVRFYVGNVVSWLFIAAAVGLSSVGVYLGRSLRWNSWDLLLSPRGVLSDLVAPLIDPLGHRQSIGMIGMFAAFIFVCYVTFAFMPGNRHATSP
jgi:uncharacterized membrane protein